MAHIDECIDRWSAHSNDGTNTVMHYSTDIKALFIILGEGSA